MQRVSSEKMKVQNVDLSGKVAVVTGASRGIGQRMAARLAGAGAAVALVARGDCAETARLIQENGGQAIVVRTDVRQPEAVEQVKQAVEAQLGTPSILVNNAGIFGPIGLIQDINPQAWIETITVNTVAPFLLCRAFVGGMVALGWGRIVNVSSAAALHNPSATNSAYATSKVALNHFTRHLAAELEGTGVTANVIHPGDVKTEMWAYIREQAEALGEIARGYRLWAQWVDDTGGDDPEKAADLVLNLMREDAGTVNGRFLWIEGGLQAPVPSWGDGEVDADLPWKK